MKMLFPLLCLTVFGFAMFDENLLFPPFKDLMDNVPKHFSRFYFKDNEENAQWLSRYLWYHFSTRMGNNPVLFNKEYLTIADMWLSDAIDKKRGKPIQEVHREDINSIRIDEEGYVHSHQHFSHAHDYGWPFPHWTQTMPRIDGYTAGWHFQEDGFGWVWDWLRATKDKRWYGKTAIESWEVENARSEGIVDGKWRLVATGASPAIITPKGVVIDAYCSPFLQLRWKHTPRKTNNLPYIEWMREEDEDFGEDRRVYIQNEDSHWSSITGVNHSIVPMFKHPKWRGKIKRIKIVLAPGESEGEFYIDSFFTVYDTRHTSNNPNFIFACWNYFRWTGDIAFLRQNINRMRLALRYMQTELGGLKYKCIRNPWWGHTGRSGWYLTPDGKKVFRPGEGIGSNYWDILPFGGYDMFATAEYYGALMTMAQVEEVIRNHPEWDIPQGGFSFDPEELRRHAEEVKRVANEKFWDKEKGRFVACIDEDGIPHDYGYTFLNLNAIWYGIATEEHAKEIMDWLDGKRIIEGDTSTGKDIYRWRFGPRASTKRNIEWYVFPWWAPESLPFGYQVQDGGGVLGFTFYDLWGRLKILGPDNAWQRLCEILDWEKEVWSEGGYREYYKDGKRGTTLQGGGTCGGIGIDFEFYESSLLPSIVVYGFLGINPQGDELQINPSLPKACPEMGISNLLYNGVRLDVKASEERIAIHLKERPLKGIKVALEGEWRLSPGGQKGSRFIINEPGVYTFVKITSK
ncbi:hypothetical protein H5T88_10165 [bacterium]|nr:hypothetical protein [bacterium]